MAAKKTTEEMSKLQDMGKERNLLWTLEEEAANGRVQRKKMNIS
jgi:hypothetical protein